MNFKPATAAAVLATALSLSLPAFSSAQALDPATTSVSGSTGNMLRDALNAR